MFFSFFSAALVNKVNGREEANQDVLWPDEPENCPHHSQSLQSQENIIEPIQALD
jgi:hypothetical protein